MISNATYIAQTRFGLGMRPDEIANVENDPRGWLMGQIRSPQTSHTSFSGLNDSQTCLREAYELQQKRKEAKLNGADPVKMKPVLKETYIKEMQARLQLAISTSTPFYERLVAFWSNHFSVSAKKGLLLGVVGAYEREAIRPYVTGKFSDMLLAVAQHPVMLMYLDNAQSIGPDSVAGERRGKGLNENLAREIMELHTLGVDGGYTQADVTSFAKVITGWSVGGPHSPNPGLFDFAPRRHEPGAQTIMGKVYSENGQGQGMDVLHDLAASPATARHLAFKLARHFVSDTPPGPVVDRLAQAFMESGGMLPPMYEALVNMPECWDAVTNPKVKDSYDLLVSAMRITGNSEENMLDYCIRSMKFLGNVPFTADSPAGFPDTAQDMLGPEALMRRVEWAQMTAHRFSLAEPASSLAGKVMGPLLSSDTLSAIREAKSEIQASAIFIGSPEFQRR